VKRRAPVRKRFPTEADWKLNTEDGRARFTISRFMVFKKDLMSSLFSEEMNDHNGWRASTMSSHSLRAELESDEERRWLKSSLIAVFSGLEGESGMRRTSRPGYSQEAEHVTSTKGDMRRREQSGVL
jgi:hypothetical protein